MKKILILLLVLFSLLLSAPTTFAQTPASDASFVPLAPIPGLTQTADGTYITPDQAGIATFLNNLYIFAIGIAVVLAIIMIIWGGTEIALNRGSVSTIMDGKGKIAQALLGLLLVLSPALVFSIINPAILNLNVNMPPLKTTWGNYTGAGGGSGTADACPTWFDFWTGGCKSATYTICGGAADCSSVITSCPSGLLNYNYQTACVRPAATGGVYSPGTNGAPPNSCNSGDAATCVRGRTWW